MSVGACRSVGKCCTHCNGSQYPRWHIARPTAHLTVFSATFVVVGAYHNGELAVQNHYHVSDIVCEMLIRSYAFGEMPCSRFIRENTMPLCVLLCYTVYDIMKGIFKDNCNNESNQTIRFINFLHFLIKGI